MSFVATKSQNSYLFERQVVHKYSILSIYYCADCEEGVRISQEDGMFSVAVMLKR